MSYFAEIDENNVVLRVIVAEQDFIDSGDVGKPSNWVETDYGAQYGESEVQGKEPLRKNYAGVGYTYDRDRDAFIPPKEFDSWILDEQKCVHVAPKDYKKDGKRYFWDEQIQDWVDLDTARGR